MLVNLRSVVGKLNPTVRAALESAAGLCLARSHYEVGVEHFLMKLLDDPASDFARIIDCFRLERSRLAAELARSLDRLKAGSARTPQFHPLLADALTKGWTFGSLELGARVIRSGFVVYALVADEGLARVLSEVSPEVNKIEAEQLRNRFLDVVAESGEIERTAAQTEVLKPAGGPPIFISYRKNDSSFYADFLFGYLRAEIADVRVFRDTDTLRAGMLFSEKITESIASCDILLALIGKKWMGMKEGGRRRIDQEDDWVRLEVAEALRLNKWVIPCLVGGAKMPAGNELPAEIAPLTERHGVTLTLRDLRRDIERLIQNLKSWTRTE